MRIHIADRKLGALLLASFLLAGNIAFAENTAQPESKVPGKLYSNGTYKYEVLSDGKSLSLRKCIKDIKLKSKKVVIPQQIDGLPVKQLGEYCIGGYIKSERIWFEEVVIPEGIESIGEGAFYGCYNLKKVKIGNDVTKINDRAFYICKSLKDIEGGKNVKYVGTEAFLGCRKLAKLPKFWSESKKKIKHGENVFSCCGLKNVTIPRWETEVGYGFFEECKSLRKVIFTKKQNNIGGESFAECRNLREVKFCPGLEIIYGTSFYWCEKLKEITIPKTVTVIYMNAFQHCRSLETVSLPNSLKELGYMAFQDCRSLKQITIPKKVKKIEKKTFQGCKNLKKAVIPKSVKKIHNTAFSGCKKLVIHCQKGSYAHRYAKKHHIKYQLKK